MSGWSVTDGEGRTLHSVAFVNLSVKEPVFHAFGTARQRDDGEWEDVTDCGVVVNTFIPTEHAVKFARPCGRCFNIG